MASSLRLNPTTFLTPRHPKPQTKSFTTTTSNSYTPTRCGPRDNRGPLVKGRVLSIEAIQAVQSLKRAQKSDPTKLHDHVSKTFSRLLKADLIAALKELLRQDHCALALEVFSVVQSEYKPDLGLYADLTSGLARNGRVEDIDRLIGNLEKENAFDCDDRGLLRLIKAVIAADRRESTVRIYGLMRRNGWGSTVKVDEHMLKVLSRGLKRLGEGEVANEVDREFGKLFKGNLEKVVS